MAESTLSLKYTDYTGGVGLFLGYGRGAPNGDAAYDARTQSVIDFVTSSGIRQFYFPPPVEGMESAYDWSFLKPIATVALPSGAQTLALPDDFGGFEGALTLLSSASRVWYAIPLVGIGTILQQYSLTPSQTGRPLMACLEPQKGIGQVGQRWSLQVFPQADQAYTLQFQYYILPDYLSGSQPYVYGGMAHSETILESCLMMAESRLDDSLGVHAQLFNQRLMASISLDRRHKPQTLGYNRDLSDQMQSGRRWWRNHYDASVTVNGVQY